MRPPVPSVVPAAAVADGIDAIRAEFELREGFPADALEEAEAAARRPVPQCPLCDLAFVTIDPPGARDLDQAMHLSRRAGGGWCVTYAIADVATFVAPGGAIDREAHRRAVTTYLPGVRIPLHPPVLSEGAASLLAGEERPALVWSFELDAEGEPRSTSLRRMRIRSQAQLDYEHVPDELATLLAEVGRSRAEAERRRGGVSLRVPEQETARGEDGTWTVAFRRSLETEEHNAQISLLTGMAAAGIMLGAGTGLLRTQPPPDPEDLERLRASSVALGAPWGADTPYPEWVRSLDPGQATHARLLRQAAAVNHGAGYVALPTEGEHRHHAIAADYAHVTAPLRRLGDRYALEACLARCAGTPVPDWVTAALPGLPAELADGARRAGRAERAAIDLVEAVVLAGRTGETFRATAIDGRTVQLAEPAVRGRLDGPDAEPGETLRVRLTVADPQRRAVRFERAAA